MTAVYMHNRLFLPSLLLSATLLLSPFHTKSWTSSVSLMMGSMMVPILVVTLGLTSWWKVNSEFHAVAPNGSAVCLLKLLPAGVRPREARHLHQ